MRAPNSSAAAKALRKFSTWLSRVEREMASKVIQSHGGLVRGNKIAQLGLSFKINTDDMRDAHWPAGVPSSAGHTTQAHACDTESMEQARR